MLPFLRPFCAAGYVSANFDDQLDRFKGHLQSRLFNALRRLPKLVDIFQSWGLSVVNALRTWISRFLIVFTKHTPLFALCRLLSGGSDQSNVSVDNICTFGQTWHAIPSYSYRIAVSTFGILPFLDLFCFCVSLCHH